MSDPFHRGFFSCHYSYLSRKLPNLSFYFKTGDSLQESARRRKPAHSFTIHSCDACKIFNFVDEIVHPRYTLLPFDTEHKVLKSTRRRLAFLVQIAHPGDENVNISQMRNPDLCSKLYSKLQHFGVLLQNLAHWSSSWLLRCLKPRPFTLPGSK